MSLISKIKIKSLKDHLNRIKNDPKGPDSTLILTLRKELSVAYKEEETYWKQKSRIQWLNEGDKNTSYFHMSTVQRRRRILIKGLQDKQGQWI